MKIKKGDQVDFNTPYDQKSGIVLELLDSEDKVRIQTEFSKWTVKTSEVVKNYGKVKNE